MSAFQVGKVPPVLGDIRADLVLGLFLAGWVLSIFNFTGLMLGTCAGAIADTIGHRRLMLAGLILQVVGSLAGSFTTTFALLLATRFLEGAGFLAVIVSVPTLIFQVVKLNDSKIALSLWSCYLPAGVSIMMFFLPFVLKFTDWRGLWQINAVLLTAYVILLTKATSHIGFMNHSKIPGFKRLFKDIWVTSTSPGPLLLALIFTTYALQWLAVMGFLPTLLLEKFHFSKSLASYLTGFMVFMNVFGNLLGGRLLKAGFARWKLIAFTSLAMGSASIAIFSSGSGFALNYTGCLTFSLIGGIIPAAVIGGAPIYAPSGNLIATTTGLLIQGGQTGQVLGPPILAWLVFTTGTWDCGSWYLGSVAMLGIIFSLLLSRIKHMEN
ncbi:MAG: MFS transporter [Desulfobacteraceae bacterium]|nr:MFS transporter [Desulfobacteraceae bacterium]